MTNKIQILYVDDDPDLSKVVKLFLEPLGDFIVTIAQGTVEAKSLLTEKSFDVIISDYLMSKMDGITFLKYLKDIGETTPFILFTGKGREEVVIEALNNGASFYLQKGGEPRSQFVELSNMVQSAVSRRRSEIDLERKNRELQAAYDRISHTEEELISQLDTLTRQKQLIQESEEQIRLYLQDLTSQEQRVRESEEKYRRLAENAQDMIFRVSLPDMRYEYVNPAVLQLTGFQPEDYYANPGFIKNLLHPDWQEWFKTEWTALLKGEMPPFYEYPIIDRDGNIRWCYERDILIKDDNGSPIAIEGVITDITKRKQAEDLLHQSEERLSTVMNGVPIFISYMDTELRFVYSNKAHAEWYGRSEEELIGKSLKELLPADIFSRAEPYYRQVLSGRETRFDNTTRDRSGQERVLHVTLVPHLHEGRVVGFFAALEDITTRKNAELALLESEERFRSIIHSMQSGIIIIDAQTHTIVEANNKALEMIGAGDESISGSICHRFICPAELGRCPVSDLGQTVDSSERLLITMQGTTIPIIKSVTQTTLGGRDVLIESFIDITERTRMELALRESEEKYRTLFDNAGDAIFIHDQNGVILSANTMACEQLGYTCPEILSMTVSQVDSPEEAPLALDRIAQLIQHGHLSFETEHLRKDGSLIPIEVRAQQIMWDGQPVVMSICRDITERKSSELAFQTLVRSIVGSTGITSLHKITENVSSWLGAECVMIGEIQPDRETVKVLSMLLDGENIPDFSYTLKGTPCDNVAEKGFCLYPDNAIQLFPESKDLTLLNIRGYMGTPLRNLKGKVIGILCALFRDPIKHSPAMQEIINIIAVKAAAEVEAMRMMVALQDSEERFRMLLEHVPSVAVQGYNMEGITQYWNEASTRLYGYTSEEAIGKNILDLIIPPGMKDEVRETFDLMSRTGEPIPAAEVSLMRKDGSLVTLFSSHAIVKRSRGSLELFCIDMDLSERKRTEEALVEANQKLRLLTGLTRHDIFNQLTAGQLYLEMALEKSDSEEQAKYISQAYEANRRIGSIIGFTREYESFGTASSGWLGVRATIDSASIEISLGTAQIENTIPDDLEVYADPILRKVFTTLMENAARHGGDLTFIRFSCKKNEGPLIITCEDDGIGIREEEKLRIFDHGYGKHTGIGLFLAREILSITGLSIRECGEPGKGARFEIMVPPGKFRRTE